jgi:RNA polymerase sigma-70 factor, ECF subfamily
MILEERVRSLNAAGQGSAAATEVIQALGPDILRYLRSLLQDEEEAADAFSRFAENLWRALPGLQSREPVRTWAFHVAWQAALDLRNGSKRHRPGEASAVAAQVRTMTVVRAARKIDKLSRLREALDPQEQSILSLRLDQQFSWEEIAEILSLDGEPVEASTVMARYGQIRERLAAMAREQGILD